MDRKTWIGLAAGGLAALALSTTLRPPSAMAQKGGEPANWEYKVATLTYNPGERLTDEQRAASYAKSLNEHAREGWEPVGSLLSRNVVQTVGGGVTTRESVSFVAYRRPRR